MKEYIIWAITISILGTAIGYVIMQKRKGVKCIGCTAEASCACPKTPCDCGCGIETISTCGCNEQHK